MESRLNGHKYSSKISNAIIYKAIRRYGWENFKVYELETNVNNRELDDLEVYWIDKMDAYLGGYNTTLGGSNNFKLYSNKDYDTKVHRYITEELGGIEDTLVMDISEELGMNVDYIITLLNKEEFLDTLPLEVKEKIECMFTYNRKLKEGLLQEDIVEKLMKEMGEKMSIERVCETMLLEEGTLRNHVLTGNRLEGYEGYNSDVFKYYKNSFTHFKYQTKYIGDLIKNTYYTRTEISKMVGVTKLYVNDVIRRMDKGDVDKNEKKREEVRYLELIKLDHRKLDDLMLDVGGYKLGVKEIANKYGVDYEVFRATIKRNSWDKVFPGIREYKRKRDEFIGEHKKMKELIVPIMTQNDVTLKDVSRITGLNYGMCKAHLSRERVKDKVLDTYISLMFERLKNTGHKLTKESIKYNKGVYNVEWGREPTDLD